MSSAGTVTRVEREFRRLDLTLKEEHKAKLDQIRANNPEPLDQEEVAGDLVQMFNDLADIYLRHCAEIHGDLRRGEPLSQGALDQLWRRHNRELDELEDCAAHLAFFDAVLTGDSKETFVDSNSEYDFAQAMMEIAQNTIDDVSRPFRIQQARQSKPEHVDLVDAYRVERYEAAEESLKIANEVAPAVMAAQTEEQVHELFKGWLEQRSDQVENEATLKSTVGDQLIHDLFTRHEDSNLIRTTEKEAFEIMRNARRLWFHDEVDDENTTSNEDENGSEQEHIEEDDDSFESDWESDDGVNVQWTAQDFQNLRNQLPLPTEITVDMAHLSRLNNRTVFQSQILDNKCSNCLYEYTEPTELIRCHHMYCFECIAPTAQGYKKCPECRAPVAMTELKIYEITRVGEAKEEEGPGAEDETMEDVPGESENEGEDASEDDMMSDAESSDDEGDASEEDLMTNTVV